MSATARVPRAARVGLVAVTLAATSCSKAKRIDRDIERTESTSTSTSTAPPPRRPDVNRFQVFEVDESLDLDPQFIDPLPEGLTIAWESVRGGLGQVRYAATTCASTESRDACCTRLLRLSSVFHPPLGTFLAAGVEDVDGARRARTWALRGDPLLTGANIKEVEAELQDDIPSVRVVLDLRATALFGAFTKLHVRDRIAILTTGFVESAPVIQSPIEGHLRITMGGNDLPTRRLDAERLAALLRGDRRDRGD